MIFISRDLSRRWAGIRLVVGGLLVSAGATMAAAPPDDGAVSADALRQHTFFLGDDVQRGRAPGTPGADAAARYIAGELTRAGLSPLGGDGEWFQDVPLHGTMPGEGTELVITSDCGEGRWRLGEDYLLSTGGVQTRIPRDVPLVFAGYGIVAPEFDYNDYRGLDVGGKVVVVLEGEPESDDPEYFAGDVPQGSDAEVDESVQHRVRIRALAPRRLPLQGLKARRRFGGRNHVAGVRHGTDEIAR